MIVLRGGPGVEGKGEKGKRGKGEKEKRKLMIPNPFSPFRLLPLFQ